MAHLYDIFDEELFERHLRERTVVVRRHPELDLSIYNYSAAVQYKELWDSVTRTCRGLVADSSGNIVARPFAKFFHLSDLDSPPETAATASVKEDGSLGIVYPTSSGPRVATRGSFDSMQAIDGTRMLAELHPNFQAPPDVTVLVEILTESSKVVVEYETPRLVGLAAIDNATGADVPLREVWDGPVAQTQTVNDSNELNELLSEVRHLDGTQREGFVLTWPTDKGPYVRAKVKSPDYVRLHAIITGVTERDVHAAVGRDLFPHLPAAQLAKALGVPVSEAHGVGFTELVEILPDELYGWALSVRDSLMASLAKVESEVAAVAEPLRHVERGQAVAMLKNHPLRHLVLTMLSDREWRHFHWRQLRPGLVRPDGSVVRGAHESV